MIAPTSIATLGVSTARADRPAGLEKATAPGGDALKQAKARKEAFGQFVGETFFGQMLKSMRQTVGEPAYFHGGMAEEQFQSRLDAQISQDLAHSGDNGLADELFRSQFPADAALLDASRQAAEADSPLAALDGLRRR